MSMLIWKERLDGCPILSLQTGGQLGVTADPIIDPRNLKIIAFYVQGPLIAHDPSVLHVSDIREFGSLGMIVNDSDVIMPLDDELVRLSQIVNYGFTLLGMHVIDTSRKKLGKVSDYVVDSDDYTITRFNVKPPLLGSIRSDLLISRQQIREINDNEIVVAAPTIKSSAKSSTAHQPATPAFENPFRKARPQAGQITRSNS